MRGKGIVTTNINLNLIRTGKGKEGAKARGDFRIKGDGFRKVQTGTFYRTWKVLSLSRGALKLHR